MAKTTRRAPEILYRADLAIRYRVCLRTIDRDAADGTLPAPRYRGRDAQNHRAKPFWWLHEVEARERAYPPLARRKANAAKPAPVTDKAV